MPTPKTTTYQFDHPLTRTLGTMDTLPCTDVCDLRGPARDLTRPRRIAPHLIVDRVLGEGGSSVVFAGIHTRLGVPVAIKVLKPQGDATAEATQRLLREAMLHARLGCPHLPRIYDVDTLDDGTPYLVMERVEGKCLEELVGQGPFEPEQAIAIAKQVLVGLSTLHGASIVHRDIKPSNLILEDTPSGALRLRLLDLGIAKPLLKSPVATPTLTAQGEIIGTPQYMAPEQLTGQDVDARADLFAVGVLLYEMLSGRPPFMGLTAGEMIAATLRDEPPPLSGLAAHLPRALTELVHRAMARSREQRPESALHMLEELEAVEAQLHAAPCRTPSGHVRTFSLAASWSLHPPVGALPSTPSPAPAPRRVQALSFALGLASALGMGLMMAWPGPMLAPTAAVASAASATHLSGDAYAESPLSTPPTSPAQAGMVCLEHRRDPFALNPSEPTFEAPTASEHTTPAKALRTSSGRAGEAPHKERDRAGSSSAVARAQPKAPAAIPPNPYLAQDAR